MSVSSGNIKRIIEAHNALAAGYNELLKIIPEGRTRIAKGNKQLVLYFTKSHIRRQYHNLYNFYLGEVISQNGEYGNNDIEHLRGLTKDLKSYYETLPDLNRLWTSIGSIIPIVVAVCGFLSLTPPAASLLSLANVRNIAILLIPFMLFGLVGLILQPAFNAKRYLFSHPHLAKEYWMGEKLNIGESNEPTSKRNLYQLEDNVYSALGAPKSKLREIPIDVILKIWVGCTTILGMLSLILPQMVTGDIHSGQRIMQLGYLALYFIIIGIPFIISPTREYKKRSESHSSL